MTSNRLHIAVATLWVIAAATLLVLGAPLVWWLQARVVGGLLTFAHVPYRVVSMAALDLAWRVPLIYKPGGQVFVIPLEYRAFSSFWAIFIVAGLGILGLVLFRWRRIPLPGKVMALFLFTLAGSAVLYTTFVSAVPPNTVNRLWIDWQYSGILIPLLISIIFATAVFPIKGPLWIKFTWMFAAIVFSFIWNTLRLSVVLSTLYHAGSVFFLMLHYLAGIYVDFIYIVAFFSLALAHLARHEVSEVGW